MTDQTDEKTLIADLRELLADGRCLCSSAHTDWNGVSELLDSHEALQQALTEAQAQTGWFRRQADHHIGRANRAEQALGAAQDSHPASIEHEAPADA